MNDSAETRFYNEGNSLPMNNNNGNNSKSSYPYREYYSMLACFCVCLVFGGLIIFFFAYVYQTNLHGHEIHHLSQNQQQLMKELDLSQLNDQRNIFSVLSQKSKNHLFLCYTNLYLTQKDLKNESLIEVIDYHTHFHEDDKDEDDLVRRRRRDASRKVNKMTRKTNDAYYYMIDAKIMIEFNVDLTKLIKNEDDLKRLKSTKKPFMSIQSDIKSNYHHFSTIKLVELGLDAQTRLLKKTHNPMTLCSQNPLLHEVPCYQENSPLLSVNYKKVTSMSHLSSTIHGSDLTSSFKEETKDLVFDKQDSKVLKTSSFTTDSRLNETEATYDLSNNNNGDVYKIKEFIEGVRIYSIQFFRKVDNSNENEELVYDETIVLSVNPNKCN
jgi:hypothetical protein